MDTTTPQKAKGKLVKICNTMKTIHVQLKFNSSYKESSVYHDTRLNHFNTTLMAQS